MKMMKFAKLYRCLAFWAISAVLIGAATILTGCTKSPDSGSESESSVGDEQAKTPEIKPEDRPYLDAARPFVDAIVARDYSKAYGYLSGHARARLSPNQFVAPLDDDAFTRNEAHVILGAAVDQFVHMMGTVEAEYGKPAKLSDMDVYSTDANVLSGKGTSFEDKMDAMFAIGMMPASIPAEIRKASLRSRLGVKLSSEQLASAAKAMQITSEELKSDPDFKPYVTLKLVLVEEGGGLKVGYFEFLPPGIMD